MGLISDIIDLKNAGILDREEARFFLGFVDIYGEGLRKTLVSMYEGTRNPNNYSSKEVSSEPSETSSSQEHLVRIVVEAK